VSSSCWPAARCVCVCVCLGGDMYALCLMVWLALLLMRWLDSMCFVRNRVLCSFVCHHALVCLQLALHCKLSCPVTEPPCLLPLLLCRRAYVPRQG
jgi:hypothetical protein